MQEIQNLLQTFGNKISKSEHIKCSLCDSTFTTPYLRTPAGDFPMYTECYPHRGFRNLTPNYNPRIIRTEEQWNKICPVQYRNTDITRLPEHMKGVLQQVNYSPRGMVFVGQSGTFKTRTMYLFLQRMFLTEHRSVKVFDGISFAYKMQDAFANNQSETWVNKLASFDCLYFDDLNQFVFTERAEQVFYQAVELRMQREKPTYYTSNLGVELLADRFSGSRGNAIIRRIEESCDVIIS